MIQKDALRQFNSILRARVLPTTDLLIHHEPYKNESLESYLFRSANNNALKSLAELERSLSLPNGKPFSYKRYEQLSTSIGGSVSRLATMIPTIYQNNILMLNRHSLLNQQLALTTSKLCPCCVKQYGYGKIYWSLAALAVCEEHGVYLIDSCICKPDALLDTARPSYSVCKCGLDLRFEIGRPASDNAVMLAEEIVRLFNRIPKPGNSMLTNVFGGASDLILTDVLTLVALLGVLDSETGSIGVRLARPLVRLAYVVPAFEKAANALESWPAGVFPLFRAALGLNQYTPKPSVLMRKLSSLSEAIDGKVTPSVYKVFLAAQAAFMQTPSAWSPVHLSQKV
ncbi:MAG: TniQ family protein [Proteobacteria bacterium]|nr:TniQ family protein [Pseudomonadota bacterium]